MSYFKNMEMQNPIKLLSNIFRYYRRGVDIEIRKNATKKKQSEPLVVLGKKGTVESIEMDSKGNPPPKEATGNTKKVKPQTSSKSFKLDVGLKKTGSTVSLSKKSNYLDLCLRETLAQMPLRCREKRNVVPAKRACPWQNYNLKKQEYHVVKPVNNISAELLSKKWSLKKQKSQLDVTTTTMVKDAKFNRLASLMVYSKPPTSGVMEQARINMSTNVRHRIGSNDIFTKKNTPATSTSTSTQSVNMSTNNIIVRHRIGDSSLFTKKTDTLEQNLPNISLKRKRHLPEEPFNGHFWYIAKKPKIC